MEDLRKELFDFLNKNKTTYAAYFRFNNPKYLHLKNFVLESIKDTPIDSDYYNWSVKCHWALYMLKDFPICKICGKKLGENKKTINFLKGYGKYCSSKCELRDADVWDKYKQTCLKKYGCESTNQSPVVKQKKVETFRERFGVDHPSQSKEIQAKIESTMLDRYGVKNAYCMESTKEKRKRVSQEKYGTEYPIANSDVHNPA